MNQKTVNILLASYNGEKFIKEQIDSIINQTYKNWRLLIRDDCSADTTLSIIKKYTSKFPSKIFLIEDNLGNLGSTQNFNSLLQHSKNADYVMFADQDDVWLNEKIDITLNKMIEAEQNNTEDFPLLVHTNFIYTDNNLEPVNPKKKFSATKVPELKFNHLLAQNPVYGCTIMMNKKLVELVNIIPANAEQHDYWVSLAASAFGKIIYLPSPTVLYRQHNANISGQHDNDSIKKRIKRNISDKAIFEDIKRKFQMASQFNNQYQKLLSRKQENLIKNFLLLSKSKSLTLVFKNLKNGIRRQTIMQTFLFYISILLRKKTVEDII